MSETSNKMRGWEWFLALLVLVPVSFITGRCTAPKVQPEPIARDTVTVTRIDTITREKPVYSSIRITDTLMVPVCDTIRVHDTLYLNIQREQAFYSDSLYQAWVSGVAPALDSIRIYSPVQTITVTEQVPVTRKTRWGIGVNAGYGATLQGKTVMLSPYIGVGISYNILSW